MNIRAWLMENTDLSPKQRRFREIFLYILFGGLTTVVNYVSFRLLYVFSVAINIPATIQLGHHNFDFALMFVNVLAWAIAVVFAFFTNRIFVFCSGGRIFSELIGFVSARIFTLVAFEVGLFMFAFFILESFFLIPKETLVLVILGFRVTWVDIIKIGVQVFVVFANYILSKKYIFNKSKKTDSNPEDSAQGAL